MNSYRIELMRETCRVPALRRLCAEAEDLRALQKVCLSLLEQLEPEHLWRLLWVLRRTQREVALSQEDLLKVAEAVAEPCHWTFRLCVGQLFAETGCPGEVRELLFPFLLGCCEDRRPIVRAWALSALCTFHDDARYVAGIRAAWRRAGKDSAKSMQARMRHLDVPFPRAQAARGRKKGPRRR